MVVAMLAAIRLTSGLGCAVAQPGCFGLVSLVAQDGAAAADRPADLLVEIERVKILLGC